MVLSILLRHLEVKLVRDPTEVKEVVHLTCTSNRMPVRLRLRAPTATCANCLAGDRRLTVRARLTAQTAQTAACSATVANASGQCGSGRGTGAPASSKRRNTAA